MSKYNEEMEDQWKTTDKISIATRDIIQSGKKLAFEEYYSAKSLKSLKDYLRNVK